jgi:hypothetical protein
VRDDRQRLDILDFAQQLFIQHRILKPAPTLP